MESLTHSLTPGRVFTLMNGVITPRRRSTRLASELLIVLLVQVLSPLSDNSHYAFVSAILAMAIPMKDRKTTMTRVA